MQTPGAVRPARPARWSALDCEIFSIEQRVDAAIGVVTRNAREAAVNHQPHAINRQRSFGDVRGHDDFALFVTRHGGVLSRSAASSPCSGSRINPFASDVWRMASMRLRNFKSARHENQHVAFAAGMDVMLNASAACSQTGRLSL